MRRIVWIVTVIGVGIVYGVVAAGEQQKKNAVMSVGFDWLAGTWHTANGDVACDEYWSKPRGGSQFGTFRMTKGGKTAFLEIFAMRREGADVSLVLRHFTPELKSWKGEEQHPQTWRLAAVEDRRAVFENARSQISYERTGDQLVVRLRPRGEAGEGQVFRFDRAR